MGGSTSNEKQAEQHKEKEGGAKYGKPPQGTSLKNGLKGKLKLKEKKKNGIIGTRDRLYSLVSHLALLGTRRGDYLKKI